MSDQIQPLLERIQSEGLNQSREERTKVLADAQSKAEAVITEAKKQAAQIISDAENQAEARLAQGTTTLEQAARDLLLKLRSEMARQINLAAEKAAAASLGSEEIISTILPELAKSGSGDLSLEAASPLAEKVEKLLPALLKDAGKEGKIIMNQKTGAGCRLHFEESAEVIDFSSQAVADWLSQNLRSDVATLLRNQTDGK